MNFDPEFLKTTLIFGGVSLIPILCWIWFFQSQNYEKKKYVIITFLAGMLSILPIKIYEKYWDSTVLYLEHLNLFKYIDILSKSNNASHFLAFLVVSILVASFMFFFSAKIMFVLEIFSRDNTWKSYRKKFVKIAESPFLFLSLGVFFGGCAAFLSFFFPEKIWFFVIVGMLEEFGKYLMLRFADEDKIGTVSDAISFAIIIALGFAFVENVFYLNKFWMNSSQDFSNLTIFFLLRSTISTIAHICFSAITGYFYGIAHFSEEIYKAEVQKNKHPLLKRLHQIFHLKMSPLFHEQKLFEGLLLAMVIHAIFNSLLEFQMVAIIIPLLVFTFLMILNLLHRRDNHVRRGHLST